MNFNRSPTVGSSASDDDDLTYCSTGNLSGINDKINRKLDKSLESTQRMVVMCEEMKDAGVRTLLVLDEQGEQLDRIEEGVEKINADMTDAEKNLEEFEQCCGLCMLPWRRSKLFGSAPKETSLERPGAAKTKVEEPRLPAVLRGSVMQQSASQCILTRITNDAREDEMEENLQHMNSMTQTLKQIALDIGCEIDNQNTVISLINVKTDDLELRVAGADAHAQKITHQH